MKLIKTKTKVFTEKSKKFLSFKKMQSQPFLAILVSEIR